MLNRYSLRGMAAFFLLPLMLLAVFTVPGGADTHMAGGRGGAVLLAGNCLSCHDREDFSLMGNLSPADFERALRKGSKGDGPPSGGSMPCAFYRFIADEDVQALYHFISGEKPAPHGVSPVALATATAGESLPGPVPPGNRGAYLVEVLGHCGYCHSPGGNPQTPLSGGEMRKWRAYNITSCPTAGIGSWTLEEITRFLQTGQSARHGTASGMMAVVVENSTSRLSRRELDSMAAHLLTSEPVNNGEIRARHDFGGTEASAFDVRAAMLRQFNAPPPDGKKLFNEQCASCHGWLGMGQRTVGRRGKPGPTYPPLTHNTTVGAGEPVNLTLVILRGVTRVTPHATGWMPGFSDALGDEEAAALVNYVSEQFGNPLARVTREKVGELRRATAGD